MTKTFHTLISRSLLLFFFCCLAVLGQGQEPAYWQLTDADGLPGRTVYRIIQDSRGFIWMGTNNGLCRYDGKTFSYFSSPLMTGNEILNVKEGPLGRINFFNLEGHFFYAEGEEVHAYKSDTILNKYAITDFEYLSTDRLLIIGRKGAEFDLLEFQRVNKDSLVFKERKLGIIGFSKKDNSLLMLNRAKTPYSYTITETSLEEPMNKLFSRQLPRELSIAGRLQLIQVPKGRNFLVYDYGIVDINAADQKLIAYQSPANRSLMVPYLIDDELWVTTRDGVLRFDFNDLTRPKTLFKGHNINCILKDKEGNYWLGTSGDGILVIPSLDVLTYSKEYSTLPDDKVLTLESAPSGELLIGQDNGYLSIIDEKASVRSSQIFDDGRVLNILPQDDKWFLCSGDKGLKLVDNQFNESTNDVLNRLWPISLKDLEKDDKGVHWIATSIYAMNMNIDMGKPSTYTSMSPVYLKKIRGRIISEKSYALHNDRFSDKMWVGTIYGLYYYQKDSLYQITEPGRASNYSIVDIQQSEDSIIWIATQRAGVLALKDNQIVDRYTVEKGLVSNSCKSIFLQGHYLWMGTDKGLNRVNRKTNRIDLINRYDGLLSNEVAAVLADEEKVWIGTSKGLLRFPLKAIKENAIPPPVYISGLKIWERDTSLTESYALNYTQNNLYIEFVGPAFRGRGNHNYQYRMLGVDNNWVTTDAHFARYPTLAPGAYEFQVLAINEDGITSEAPARLYFDIAAPWWQRWWFRSFALLAIIGLTAGGVYWRFYQIRQRDKEQQAIRERFNELEMQALQVQMNPHFVFNALNAIQKYLTTNEQEEAMRYLAKFARLIRLIFEHSKKKVISLEDELDFLNLYLNLEQLRFKSKIDIQLDVANSLKHKADEVLLPPLLIQPIVENSFKHGLLHKKGTGKLNIRFEEQANFLQCTIEDDGVGRQQAEQYNNWRPEEYKSSGLATTVQRLSLFNQSDTSDEDFRVVDLYNDQSKSVGTRIIMRIRKA